ncbi:MAG: hypothetical protein IKC46_11870 [Lachnospiraceae bacterium]|nr:hypothetical protein [Lachnospiraceae bacterium]
MVDKNKVAGGGTRSAVTEKSSKASGRKWPAVSSAKKQSMKDTEGRSWDKPGDNKLGGGTASAAQSPNSKAERRIWPEQSSARKRQE